MSNISFNVKLLIGFLAAIVIITIINIAGLSTLRSLTTTNGWIAHTHEVIEQTQKIELKLADADNAHNQYLLSGNTQYLNNYKNNIENLLPEVQALKLMVSDNLQQVRKADSLAASVRILTFSMQNIISDARKKPTNQILLWNKSLLDCKRLAQVIIINEHALLSQRNHIGRKKIFTTYWIERFSVILVVLLLISLFIFITRAFIATQKLKDQLQLSESIFSGVFNDSGIGMAIVSLNGRWMNINPYLSGLLGYSREELFSKTFQDITHPDDLEADLSLVQQILDGKIDTYKLEKRYFHKEGHILWAMLTVSVVRNDKGEPRFFVSQIEDITGIKQLIQEQERRNMVLSQTSSDLENKMQQLQDFNSIVAHNLRGPIRGIEMMLKMVKDETDPVERESMIDLVCQSGKTLDGTLNDLMKILEIRLNHNLEYNDCDLKEITETTTGMLQSEILRSKAKITTDFSVPFIKFPKVYLESIFYNMFSNSLKYKKAGMPVAIHITSVLENGKTKLTFADNGLGIDLQQYGDQMFKLNKVFHQGYDSKGVGLFITKNQIEIHGGSITVESTPGAGTKFTICLPQ